MKARCGVQQCFHGAYAKRGDAKKKAATVKGAHIKNVRIRAGDYRWLVMSPKK